MILFKAIIAVSLLIPVSGSISVQSMLPEDPRPSFELVAVSSGVVRTAFAYNSVPGQTDGAPCIAADGSDICARLAAGECIIAGNFAHLGSQHYLDGIGLCTLADRMNGRYGQEIDLFLGYDVAAARKFGRRQIIVKSLN